MGNKNNSALSVIAKKLTPTQKLILAVDQECVIQKRLEEIKTLMVMEMDEIKK